MVNPSPRAAPYHHGRLRDALVQAATTLIEEGGPSKLSVREAARRAGVSPGAPFRHFPGRAALITAVAEAALGRLRAQIDEAVARADRHDPLAGFGALMVAVVRWSARNPALFEALTDRRGLDLRTAPGLKRDLARAQALAIDLLTRAGARGLLRSGDLFEQVLAARALALGLARLHIDRGLAEWGVDDKAAEQVMVRTMTHFLRGLAAAPDRHGFTPGP